MTVRDNETMLETVNTGENPPEDLDRTILEAYFLHFFANVNLAADAVEMLNPSGFSVIRNRILGFATLTPGLTVGELVRALRVPHQNINSPLGKLIREGFVIAEIGTIDRRQKRLSATQKGRELYFGALRLQTKRMERALGTAGPRAMKGFIDMHRQIVEPADLEWIDSMLDHASGNS